MKQKIKTCEEDYFDLLDNANDLIQSVDAEGKYLFVNQKWLNVLGYNRKELLSLKMENIIHPRQLKHCLKIFKRVIKGAPQERLETIFKTKKGDDVYVEGNVNARFENEKFLSTRGIFRDVTEQKKTEEKLRQAVQEWSETFDAIGDLISIHDKESRIIRVNKAFADTFKMKPEELIGQHCYEWFHGTNKPIPECPFQKTMDTKQPARVEIFEPNLGIYLEVYASPVFDDKGDVVSCVHVARDITQQKKTKELIQSRLKFEQTFSMISSMFVGQYDLDKAIDEVLAEIGTFSNVSRVYLFLLSEDGATANKTHEWCAEGIEVHQEKRVTTYVDKVPYFMKLYRTRGQIIVPGIDSLPAEAGNEKKMMEEVGAKARLVMSMFDASGKLTGYVGCDDCVTPREWSDADISLLQLTADILGNAIERKQAEELYTTVVNSSPIGIYIIQDRFFKFVNPQFQLITGYPSDELLKIETLSIVHPEDRQMVRDNAVKMLKNTKSESLEFRIIRKDGEIRWAMETVLSISYRGRRASLGSFMDVTERKNAEIALHLSEQNFRNSLDNSPMGILIFNDEGETFYINRALLDIVGYESIEEYLAIPMQKRYTPEGYAKYEARQEKIRRGEDVPPVHEIDIVRKDGEIRHLEAVRKEVMWNGQRRNQVLYSDITDRKKAEEALQLSEQNFRSSLDSSPLGILISSPKDELLYVNQGLLDIFGYDDIEEFKRTPLQKRFTPEYYIKHQAMAKKITNGEYVPSTHEIEIVRKNGEIRNLEAVRKEVLWNGQMQNQVLHMDITERKKAEAMLQEKLKELEEANNRLKELDKLKDNFLSTVSHELRTPLTSIKSFAEILLTYEEDRATQKEFLGIINEESDRLTRLINDFLDLSKIQAGKMHWETSEVLISWAIETAVNATRSLVNQNSQELSVEIAPELPPVSADKDRLVQVVTNLLSNAIKFTPSGGKISIEARLQKNDEKPDNILVSVTDSGIGIAPEHHRSIFEKFGQVGDTLKDRPKGTGLGLPISKEIVEHYGGKIWVESEPGKGSTFFFNLPGVSMILSQTIQIEEKPKAAASPKEKTILVVDDEANIRRLIEHELALRGYKVLEAATGKEAIDLARKHHPDLITLDIVMPDLDGFDVTAVLKHDAETMNIPILIVSVVEGKAKAYQLGANDYITKPFSIETLIERVNNLLRGSQKSVLVVDDDEALVKSLDYELRKRGFSTSLAYNGKQALDAVEKNHPSLILLDINMPVMNGYEVIKVLKNNSQTAGIPVVIMTGVEIDGGRVKALSVGAAEYINKLGGFSTLFDTVERILTEKPGE